MSDIPDYFSDRQGLEVFAQKDEPATLRNPLRPDHEETVMVPAYWPTEAMIEAGYAAYRKGLRKQMVYFAMLAAAPEVCDHNCVEVPLHRATPEQIEAMDRAYQHGARAMDIYLSAMRVVAP